MKRIAKGALYQSASGEVVMYCGIIVDHDGTWYEIQRFGGELDRVAIDYFHAWYRPAYDRVSMTTDTQWRTA